MHSLVAALVAAVVPGESSPVSFGGAVVAFVPAPLPSLPLGSPHASASAPIPQISDNRRFAMAQPLRPPAGTEGDIIAVNHPWGDRLDSRRRPGASPCAE